MNRMRLVLALTFSLILSNGCQDEVAPQDAGTLDGSTHDADVDVAVDDVGPLPDTGPDGSTDADSRPDVQDADIPTDAEEDAEEDESFLFFNIILRQTHQACDSCGIWFDWQGAQDAKPRVVVRYQHLGLEHRRTYQHGLDDEENAFGIYIVPGDPGPPEERLHSLLIKDSPRRVGLFLADMSDIPVEAEILEARLHLHIHTGEGLANSDHSSVLAVYECPVLWRWTEVDWTNASEGVGWTTAGGDMGALIREIRAQEDLWDQGFNKANPNASFDFTDYVRELQGRR